MSSSTANSSSLSGSVLGGSRTGPSGSVDDTYIANIIWDSPPRPDAPVDPSSGLQKSPLHKSTSALTDIHEDGGPPGVQSSANYQGHPYVTSPNSRSYSSNHHSTSVSNHQHHEGSSSGRRNPSGGGLPDFNLTDEIFQHFLRSNKQVTPPPSGIPDYISPRQPSSESYSHFPMPNTSSPIKRTSSPDMGVRIPPRGDQHARSNSPDVFLPTPEHLHWQQPMSHSYSNSYHPPMPAAYTSTPSRSNSKPNVRPGMTGANPQPVSGSYWHDGMGTGYQQQAPPVLRHHHSDVGPHREEGGAFRQGQHPPRSAAILSPRQQKEESIDMQEFLQTINDSATNPFGAGGGGTLV